MISLLIIIIIINAAGDLNDPNNRSVIPKIPRLVISYITVSLILGGQAKYN